MAPLNGRLPAMGAIRRALHLVVGASLLLSSTASPASAAPAAPAPTSTESGSFNRVPGPREVDPLPLTIPERAGNLAVNPGVVESTEPSGEAPPVPERPTEMPELRAEQSRTLANPDGTLTTEISSGRVNYSDESGAWQPIETELVAADTAVDGFNLRQRANDIDFVASDASAGEPFARLALDDLAVTIRGLDMDAGSAARDESGLRFAGRAGGADLEVRPTPEGFQFQIVLAEAGLPGTYRFAVDAPGLSLRLGRDGAIELVLPAQERRDVDGNPLDPAPGRAVGIIGIPSVYDASGEGPGPIGVSVRLDPDADDLRGSETAIVYEINPDWLADPERRYPVTLDPTVCIQPGLTSGGCTIENPGTGFVDHFVSEGVANIGSWNALRVGWDWRTDDGGVYEKQRGLVYFPYYPLLDGAHVTEANLQLHTQANYVNRTIVVKRITEGWATNYNWSNQPDVTTTSMTTTANCEANPNCYVYPDVTDMVRSMYTRRPADWVPNLGFRLELSPETTNEVRFDRGNNATVGYRPRLDITYEVPKFDLAFQETASGTEPGLGADWVPSQLAAGHVTRIPVVVYNQTDNTSWGGGNSNTTPAFTFNRCATTPSNCYRVGWRFFDDDGNVVGTPGTADLAAAIAAGSSATVDLPITPPAEGEYTLRIELMHQYAGDQLWTSDWAQPGKYYAREKAVNTSTNTRWTGSSMIDRAEFSVLVTAGGGPDSGAPQGVALADGSQLSIDLWSDNLHYGADTDLGFADLGTDVGLSYYYDSARRTVCTSIVQTCGWFTNYDESIRTVEYGRYEYRDSRGNTYRVNRDHTGQLTSSAPVLIERPRFTAFDENLPSALGNAVTSTTAFSGSRSLSIAATVQATVGGFGTVSLRDHPLVSFAMKSSGTDKGAIGYRVLDRDNGSTVHWFFYTLGSSSWTVPGFPSTYISGSSLTNWRHIVRRNLYSDVKDAIPGIGDNLEFGTIDLRSQAGASGNLFYDAIRLEGRVSPYFDDTIPSGMSGAVSLNTTDHVVGTASLEVTSPGTPGTGNAAIKTGVNINTREFPFVEWNWKKVGGSTVAIAVNVLNTRTGDTDWICYYAGTGGSMCTNAQRQLQVSETAPDEWTRVTRNVLDDARQALAWYNDNDVAGTSQAPNGAPTPDRVRIIGYKLIPWDGHYALFDRMSAATIPNPDGDLAGQTQAPDFRLTLPGGEIRRFERDGELAAIQDIDGNATELTWTTDWATGARTLDLITAPGDGMALSDATAARRRLDVTATSTSVQFSEQLGRSGDTGRMVQFNEDANGDLASVTTARHGAVACAGSGPSGCSRFTYTNTSGHFLHQVRDARSAASDNNYHQVNYSGARPNLISEYSSGSQVIQLRVLNVDAVGTLWPRRVEYQDAAMVLANQAAYVDLQPNGGVTQEWASVGCTIANCASGTTSPAAASLTSRLRAVTVDGIDNVTSETVYRTGSSADPITTRRGTLAAAKIDNHPQPLVASQTVWTESAAEAVAGVQTMYTYDELGRQTSVRTPHTISAAAPNSPTIAQQTFRITYDAEGHPLQSEDNFVLNPGFEDGLTSWTGSGTWYAAAPPSGAGALGVSGNQISEQGVILLPGQTYRFQTTLRTASGSGMSMLTQWQRSDGVWIDHVAHLETSSSFVTRAFEATIPFGDATGTATGALRIRLGKDPASQTGVGHVDDISLLTAFGSATYQADGLPLTRTDVDGIVTRFGYGGDHATSGLVATDNLLTNGGFTGGTTGWTPDVGSGTTVNSSGNAAWTLRDGETPSAYATLGSGPHGWSGRVTINSASVGVERLSQAVAATPGQAYSASVLLGARDLDGAWLRLEFKNSGGTVLHSVRSHSRASLAGVDRGAWDYHSLTAVAPAGTANVVVHVEGGPLSAGASSGLMPIDHVRLVTGSRPMPYVAESNQLPAVLPTSVTANYVSGGPVDADTNVTSFTAYDRWGRPVTSIDPDGVASMSGYAANATDLVASSDGLGNLTRTTDADALGNPLEALDPRGGETEYVYNLAGQVTETDHPDGREDVAVYDAAGRVTDAFVNYANGVPSDSDLRDVRTRYTYDVFGNVIQEIADADKDAGGEDVAEITTDRTFDQLGHLLTETVYPDAQSDARTTTTFYDAHGRAVSSQLPVSPASPAPFCLGTSGTRCHSRAALDLAGRPLSTTDAYGIVSATDRDFAGSVVRTIANRDNGVYSAAAPDTDIVTVTTHDIAGRANSVTDTLGNVTTTGYDALGRATLTTRPDDSWIEIRYTAGGRTDVTSSVGGSTEDADDTAWTRSAYDAAGRQTHTLRDVRLDGNAGWTLRDFEADALGLASAASDYLSAGATLSHDTTLAASGARSLLVSTAATANQGASLQLPGTYVSGHTYTGVVWARGNASGQSWAISLGTAADNATATLTSDGNWQKLEVGWSPATTTTGPVRIAFRANHGTATAAVVNLDDMQVSDAADPQRGVPTATAFDAAGNVTASIETPAAPGERPMVTTSAYDTMGRLTDVMVAARAGAGTLDPDLNLATTSTYDELGNLLTQTDPAGVVTRATHDRLGRRTISVANYNAGAPGTLTDVDNVTAKAAYNDRGELTASCTPAAVVEDACNPNSTSTGSNAYRSGWHYAYDAMGHQTAAIAPVNTLLAPLSTTSSIYDAAGLRLARTCSFAAGGSCASASRYTDLAHDDLGRVTSATTYAGAVGSGTERIQTDTTYDGLGRALGTTLYLNGSGTAADGLATEYDALSRPTAYKRSSTLLTGFSYAGDGSLATATSPAGVATFSHDRRDRLASASSPTFTGAVTHDWRADGLLAARTYPGDITAGATYDAASRPTSMEYLDGATPVAEFGRGYDRVGNVTTESRDLPGVAGDAGTGTQSFTYDALRRVTGSSLGADARGYTYDAGSRRTSASINGVTTTFTYDRADQLVEQIVASAPTNFTYDVYGNLVERAVAGTDPTIYAYDLADRLIGFTPDGGDPVTYTLDAAGRRWTRSLDGTLDATYTYHAASNQVSRITAPGLTTDAAFDPAGTRLATATSASGFGWLLADLHGNAAATAADDFSSIDNAFRYDPYGQLIDSVTDALPTPWRFGGRLHLDPDGGTDLYDWQARAYDPGLGAFTSLDSVTGSVESPLTLNRYLFTHANPMSLIDPDGHSVDGGIGNCIPSCPAASPAPPKPKPPKPPFIPGPAVTSGVDPAPSSTGTWRPLNPGPQPGPAPCPAGQCETVVEIPSFVMPEQPLAPHHIILGGCGVQSWSLIAQFLCDVVDGAAYATEGEIGDAAISIGAALVFLDPLKASKLVRVGDALPIGADDIVRNANVDDFVVKPKHLPGASGNWRRFADGVDPQATVRGALSSDTALIFVNHDQFHPDAFRVIADLGQTIGSRGETALQIVVKPNGDIVTAYPIPWP